MSSNEAARPLRQQGRANGSHRTRSIISDLETFALVMAALAFTAACVAVPTIMAALKAMGVW